jgi:hypothetical protein
MLMINASRLSDSDLMAELSRLARGEREATAALIVHLAEFDARRLFEGAGYPSMFQYGQAMLRMSEDAVYNRIAAARAARRFPAIVDMLVSGALSPTTARLLSRHLTDENQEALLAAASGLGKLAVEELLARWFPQPDVAPRIRKLPIPSPMPIAPPSPVAADLVRNARRPAVDVRRAVTARDGGRRKFVAKDGHRCRERRFLEFHHIRPYAAGGRATVDNIELRCRAHNGYEVDRFFGPGWRHSRDGRAGRTRSGTSRGDWRTPPPAG